jgi:two-component system sensor histidine kinase UhpB
MTLAARLIILVAGALLLSLLTGGVLVLVGASQWVRAEVDTAAHVARELVDQRLAEAAEESESPERLTELLHSLETGNHVRAVYQPGDTEPGAAEPPPAPTLLSRLLGVHATVEVIPAALPGEVPGRIILSIDPEREVAQVGQVIEIGLAALIVFSMTTLVLVAIGLTRSLRPLGALGDALSRVGTGDYSARIEAAGPIEIARLGGQFNHMADQLREMQGRTRALNAQLLAVQDRERREIARDLHDDLGPCLLAANLDVSALIRLNRSDRRDAIEECAAGLATVIQRMQDLVRRLITRLHLDPAEGFDLAAELDDLVEFWRERCPGIAFEVARRDSWPLFAAAPGVTLMRVAQEALTNAVRHSGAGRITLGCARCGDDLVLEIADDGIGMGEGIEEGIGLTGMRDRIEATGGVLDIISAPGRGTIIRARVPAGENRS